MNPVLITLIIIAAILAIVLAVLAFIGKKAQKKQEEQQAQIEAAKRYFSMLTIDKKRMKIKEAGLPQIMVDQTPWYLRGTKLPILKAKVGPQIMNFICDDKIFDQIPLKKEIKAGVSGIYITEVKGIHGKLPVEENGKKKGFWRDLIAKAQEKAGAKPV